MAKASERVFAIVAVIIFLISSVALTGAVLWQVFRGDKSNNNAANQTKQSQEGALQGTKLTGFEPVAKIDSLQTVDQVPGNGDVVKAGDTVTVHYTGAVAATGVIFQSSKDTGQTVSFGLDQVIKGWTEGVPGMKVGGTRRLLIPADKAYGANPPPGSGIPANADLVFDIELVKIGQ